MGDAVTGISKKQDEADALKKFDDGNIVYSLVKKKPKGKETELVCGNNTGTLNKENALAWLKFTDENEFHTNDRSHRILGQTVDFAFGKANKSHLG